MTIASLSMIIEEAENLDTHLRKQTTLTLIWGRGQPWHSFEEEDKLETHLRKRKTLTLEADNLDNRLRKRTTLTIVWGSGQPWHSIEEADIENWSWKQTITTLKWGSGQPWQIKAADHLHSCRLPQHLMDGDLVMMSGDNVVDKS